MDLPGGEKLDDAFSHFDTDRKFDEGTDRNNGVIV